MGCSHQYVFVTWWDDKYGIQLFFDPLLYDKYVFLINILWKYGMFFSSIMINIRIQLEDHPDRIEWNACVTEKRHTNERISLPFLAYWLSILHLRIKHSMVDGFNQECCRQRESTSEDFLRIHNRFLQPSTGYCGYLFCKPICIDSLPKTGFTQSKLWGQLKTTAMWFERIDAPKTVPFL